MHPFDLFMILVVFVSEADEVIFIVFNPCVVDGNFVGIAGKIADDRFRALEVGLTEDISFMCHELIEYCVNISGNAF